MTKQVINVGTSANDRKGDSLRAAFTKVNANFTELYAGLNVDGNGALNLGAFEFTGSTMSTTDSSSIIIDQATSITSNLTVGGTLTFPDNLTIADGVIGKSSSNTISDEQLGQIISETATVESQIEITTAGITIAKRARVTVNDGVTTSTDEDGSALEVTSTSIGIKRYANPEGPNNSSYFQISTSNAGAVIEGVEENVDGGAYARITTSQSVVEISTRDNSVDSAWLFEPNGVLTLPQNGDIVDINGNTVLGGGGNSSVTTSDVAPSTPDAGDLWYDTVSGRMYVYFDSVWVDSNPVDGVGSGSGDRLTNGLNEFVLGVDGAITAPYGKLGVATGEIFGIVAEPDTAATIQSDGGTYAWGFNTDGTTSFPSDTIKAPTGTYVQLSDNAGKNFVTVTDEAVSVSTELTTEYNWSFRTDGKLQMPNGYALTAAQNTIVANNAAPTVVYTSLDSTIGSIKAIVKVFTRQADDGSGNFEEDTQICEMLITVKGNFFGGIMTRTAVATVYGVTHTSGSPLATFTVNYVENIDGPGTRDVMQILAEPTAEITGADMWVMVTATELTND